MVRASVSKAYLSIAMPIYGVYGLTLAPPRMATVPNHFHKSKAKINYFCQANSVQYLFWHSI